ncbi:helix-turn-helix domain-containing protein [Mucilaginibacter sp. UR6-11]|uniref:helix-turn-helix domain-containing protein n=1 Tax=Mucilaginibacter sp. UR6-11 TaxID=1435644 RepID=UPI00351CD7A5
MNLLAENVKRHRIRKNLSQESLANQAGIGLSTISRIERGVLNSSVSIIIVLAKVLEIEPGELLRRDLI